MPEPDDTIAAITDAIATAAGQRAAGEIRHALLRRFNLPPDARANLSEEPTLARVISEEVGDAIASSAPTIIGDALGGWTPPGGSAPEATVTMPAASWDVSDRPMRDGRPGSTLAGAFLVLDDLDTYVWWSHDDGSGRFVGIDPGEYEAGLAGLSGVEVQLDAGNVSGADVALATATVLQLAEVDASASGADLTITGTETLSTSSTTWGSRGDAGIAGNRRQPPAQFPNFIVNALGSHMTWDRGDARIVGFAIELREHDSAEQVSCALFRGGDASSLVATSLVATAQTSGTDANRFVVAMLESSDVVDVSDGDSLRVLARGNTLTTRVNFSSTSQTDGVDFTVQNLEIFPDVSVDLDDPWPSTLEGETVTTAFGVFLKIAVIYQTAPFVGDGSMRQILGVHTDDIFDSTDESALILPDANGANVHVALEAPDVLGLQLHAWRYAAGSVHAAADQFRGGVSGGGVLTDADGATVLWDAGQASGTATEAWVEILAPTGMGSIDVDPGSLLWWDLRGGGGSVTTARPRIRFALGANPQFANADADPCDFGATAEYEQPSTNTAHSTSPAVAFESPIVGGVDDFLPGNYPGCQVVVRLPGLSP